MTKCYSELILLPTFEERFEYLKLSGAVGAETFGRDRWINQVFYHSPEWRTFRNKIIIRDNGCDLGVDGYEIKTKSMLSIHHINPVSKWQILERDPCLLDPENVITVAEYPTHKAIHYGDSDLLLIVKERTPNDTCLWK